MRVQIELEILRTLHVVHCKLKVQIANTQNLEERDSSMPNKTICDGDTVGSVDVWKNYLAVGSAELKVVNLDSGRALQRSSSQVS